MVSATPHYLSRGYCFTNWGACSHVDLRTFHLVFSYFVILARASANEVHGAVMILLEV